MQKEKKLTIFQNTELATCAKDCESYGEGHAKSYDGGRWGWFESEVTHVGGRNDWSKVRGFSITAHMFSSVMML